jgi:hypothetical protein
MGFRKTSNGLRAHEVQSLGRQVCDDYIGRYRCREKYRRLWAAALLHRFIFAEAEVSKAMACAALHFLTADDYAG